MLRLSTTYIFLIARINSISVNFIKLLHAKCFIMQLRKSASHFKLIIKSYLILITLILRM
jgi:hypothetical protein